MLCVSGMGSEWSKRSVNIECIDGSASDSETDTTASWQLALFEDGTFLLEIESCPPQDTAIGWQDSAALGQSLCSTKNAECPFN
eukprot:COSAG05_NODE_18022_length_315_cov_0.805556_1_plen_83_part_01